MSPAGKQVSCPEFTEREEEEPLGFGSGPGAPRVLLLYTVLGRGGDAVQLQVMGEALRRMGWEPAIVGGRPLRPYCFTGTLDRSRRSLKLLPWWTRDLLEYLLNLVVLVRGLRVSFRFRPQLILEHMTPYGPAGLLLSRILRVPLVLHLDAPFAAERSFRGEGIFTTLHGAAVRRAARRAVAVALGTEFSRDHYLALGVSADKVVLVRNGVLARELRPPRAEAPGAPVIGFVGSLACWHRVDLLVDAVAELRSKGLPVSLTIVGMGEDYPKVAARVAHLELGNAVRFTGPLDREATLSAIESFQVAVLPHTLTTGSPMKLFDYAACRVPMVAPDLPNLRQVWGTAAAAYFTPGDPAALARAIGELLASPGLRRELAGAAWRLVAERYTWERQLGELLARAGWAPLAARATPDG